MLLWKVCQSATGSAVEAKDVTLTLQCAEAPQLCRARRILTVD